MKHIYLQKNVSLTLIAISVLFASCSTDDSYTESNHSNVENVKVIKELEDVNDCILANSVPKTRRWTTKQKLNVVKADIGGAWAGCKVGAKIGGYVGMGLGSPVTGGVFGGFLGGVIGGACSSWLAAPESRAVREMQSLQVAKNACVVLLNDDLTINEEIIHVNNLKASNKLVVDNTLLKSSNLDNKSLQIGKMHNIILSSFDGSVTIDSGMPFENSSELKISLLNSTELMDSCKNVAKNASLQTLVSSDILLNRIMALFDEVFTEYASEANDVAFIISKYVEVIDASDELTDDQKESVKSGLATALYSYQYWDEEFGK